MPIYKTKNFERWARKAGLGDNSLCKAVREMERGLHDADLGGGVFKKRIARLGQGKRDGFRTIVATNKGGNWFFIFGWPKNERSNINDREEAALKRMAAHLLTMTPKDLSVAEDNNEIMEVTCHE
jgi:hypothetical protein